VTPRQGGGSCDDGAGQEALRGRGQLQLVSACVSVARVSAEQDGIRQ
jgi:hypothetical protein